MITSHAKTRRDSQDSCDSLIWRCYASAERQLCTRRVGSDRVRLCPFVPSTNKPLPISHLSRYGADAEYEKTNGSQQESYKRAAEDRDADGHLSQLLHLHIVPDRDRKVRPDRQLWRARWQSRAVGRRTIAAPKREEVRGDRPGQVGVPFRGLHEILRE
jgi:hypothetical protein